VESDEEGFEAEAAAVAARRVFAMQSDSLFGLDSQSQQIPPMLQAPEQDAPAQVRLSINGTMILKSLSEWSCKYIYTLHLMIEVLRHRKVIYMRMSKQPSPCG